MLEPVLLADTLKEFLEDPAWLIGVPLVALGALGALLAMSPAGVARPQAPAAEGIVAGHPTPEVYIRIALILAVITAVEVAVYYVDALQGALLSILLILSAGKFVLVALFFMHLRFDNRIFSTLFTGGLLLVAVLFAVVLSTLGASLV